MSEKKTFEQVLTLENSGSGKSWLAARLRSLCAIPKYDLDMIH